MSGLSPAAAATPSHARSFAAEKKHIKVCTFYITLPLLNHHLGESTVTSSARHTPTISYLETMVQGHHVLLQRSDIEVFGTGFVDFLEDFVLTV